MGGGELLSWESRVAACGNFIMDERSAHWKYSEKLEPLQPTVTEVLTELWSRETGNNKSDCLNPWKSREDEDKESDWVLTLPPQNTLQDKCYLRCVELALMGNMNPLLLINIFFVYPGALTTSYLCEAAQSVVELDGPEI